MQVIYEKDNQESYFYYVDDNRKISKMPNQYEIDGGKEDIASIQGDFRKNKPKYLVLKNICINSLTIGADEILFVNCAFERLEVISGSVSFYDCNVKYLHIGFDGNADLSMYSCCISQVISKGLNRLFVTEPNNETVPKITILGRKCLPLESVEFDIGLEMEPCALEINVLEPEDFKFAECTRCKRYVKTFYASVRTDIASHIVIAQHKNLGFRCKDKWKCNQARMFMNALKSSVGRGKGYNVTQLRKFCKMAGVSCSGRKGILIDRLLNDIDWEKVDDEFLEVVNK